MRTNTPNHPYKALLAQRAGAAEHTRVRLHQALDRFERGELIHVGAGSKLTLRNLAIEAGDGMSKDTPLSRFPREHSKAGEYRFPCVAARFKELKERKRTPRDENPKDRKIRELRELIQVLEDRIISQARIHNQLDAAKVEAERRCKELEEQNANLRKGQVRDWPWSIKGVGRDRGR